MAAGSSPDVTRLLVNWSNGDQSALTELMPVIYTELRRLASSYLRRERPNHTLQSTALVHEAFLRLIHQQVEWRNRTHFYGIAAQMIRRILVDYARSHDAEKRGAGAVRLELDEALAVPQQLPGVDLLALNDALDRLAEMDERQSRIVELRFFAGLSIQETADLMELSIATVNREWATAKAWLFREVSHGRSNG